MAAGDTEACTAFSDDGTCYGPTDTGDYHTKSSPLDQAGPRKYNNTYCVVIIWDKGWAACYSGQGFIGLNTAWYIPGSYLLVELQRGHNKHTRYGHNDLTFLFKI